MLRPTSRFALPSANSILFYSLSFLATTISANALPQITQAATSIVLEPLGGLGEGTTISGVPGGLGDPTGGLGGPTATGMAESAANPFGFPAPPQPPNYIDPETRAPLVIGVNALFVGLSFICVILRYWSRLKIVGTTFLEDWLAALAWVSHWGFSLASLAGVG